MAQPRFQIKVIGEGKARVKGVLGFVTPQALDLVTRSLYTVTISEVGDSPPGALHLGNAGYGVIEVQYHPNPNRSAHPIPEWTQQVIKMSDELGKRCQWRQPQQQT